MPSRLVSEVIRERAVPVCASTTTVANAAKIMKASRSSALLIVDQEVLVGICTERDIVFGVVAADRDTDRTSVGAVMTKAVQTIGPDKPFGHALHLMYEGGFRHVPVVDLAGHALGLLTAQDALDSDGLQLGRDLIRREEITAIL